MRRWEKKGNGGEWEEDNGNYREREIGGLGGKEERRDFFKKII